MDRDNNKGKFSPPLVGGSSILVIFAVLCLTVFALLGLSTVKADGRLSDASAKAVSDYYAADYAAEEIFALLRSGQVPENVSEENGCYFYTCPISETMALEVELEKSGKSWTVLRWQAVSVADWEPDMDLGLWDGGLPEGVE